MEDWQTIVLAIFGGGTAGAVLAKLIDIIGNRRKVAAETEQIVINTKETAVNTEKMAAEKEKIETETKITAAEYHERTSNDLAAMVVEIKAAMAADKAAATAEIASIKAAQEEGQRRYEERAGSLVTEIKALSAKLDFANEAAASFQETIKQNNITITELKGEVADANKKIASLQDVITTLQQRVNDLLERLVDSK